MSKRWIILLFFCCFTYSCKKAESPVEPQTEQKGKTVVDLFGQIHVSGNKIVDKNNAVVALHGMSLFWSQWGGSFYNEKAIQWLRDDWQCTIVRAACGVESGGYLTNPQAEAAKVSAVVDACIKLGIYVVIDWHDHHAQDHKAEAKEFFRAVALKYGDKPNIIYELYNEPLQVSWSGVIKPYAEEVIKVIRQYDPDNLIVVGNPNWSQDVDVAAKDPVDDKNVAYSLHFYTGTHRQSLRDKAAAALNAGAALFVTEYGISEASGTGVIDYAETAKWTAFVKANSLSDCNWSVVDKDETSAALKPGAAGEGNWSSNDLSVSGKYIRDYIRSLNSDIFKLLETAGN